MGKIIINFPEYLELQVIRKLAAISKENVGHFSI